jgi:putative toxin-antitoxin system antitoxin component (TIGR02293 family)
MHEAFHIAEVMGGRPILGKRIASKDDLEQAVMEGLPKGALRATVRRVFPAAADANRFIYGIVPQATYKRRTHRLRPDESERTERLARVIADAENVWSNLDDARAWLTTAHAELRGRTPIDCAMTELGARKVEEVLNRLRYGLPA